jgi:flagellar protein FlaI
LGCIVSWDIRDARALDASLPDDSPIQMSYGNEIIRRDSIFTIRIFRRDPLTISDPTSFGTFSSELAAYFWYANEIGHPSLYPEV